MFSQSQQAEEAEGKIKGITMGSRLVVALAQAVEAVGGAEAVQHLHIVLHCNEIQENDVVEDLLACNFCGCVH